MSTTRTKICLAALCAVAFFSAYGCSPKNADSAAEAKTVSTTVVDPVSDTQIPQAQRDALAKERADDALRAAETKGANPK